MKKIFFSRSGKTFVANVDVLINRIPAGRKKTEYNFEMKINSLTRGNYKNKLYTV